MQRDATGLDALVAAFSTGPVGLGDGPGYTDAALALATCRADETLLQVRACSVMQCSAVYPVQCSASALPTYIVVQVRMQVSVRACAHAMHMHACVTHSLPCMTYVLQVGMHAPAHGHLCVCVCVCSAHAY